MTAKTIPLSAADKSKTDFLMYKSVKLAIIKKLMTIRYQVQVIYTF